MIRLAEPCEKYLESYIDACDGYSAHSVPVCCFDDVLDVSDDGSVKTAATGR